MYYKKHKGELKSDLIALFVTLAISFVAAIVLGTHGVDISGIFRRHRFFNTCYRILLLDVQERYLLIALDIRWQMTC